MLVETLATSQVFRVASIVIGIVSLCLGADALRWIWGRRKVHLWAWVPISDIFAFLLLDGLILFINIAAFLVRNDAHSANQWYFIWAFRAMTFLIYIKLLATWYIMRRGLGEKAKLGYSPEVRE
jgi:hypothetical protein